jgi:hypothetical protein
MRRQCCPSQPDVRMISPLAHQRPMTALQTEILVSKTRSGVCSRWLLTCYSADYRQSPSCRATARDANTRQRISHTAGILAPADFRRDRCYATEVHSASVKAVICDRRFKASTKVGILERYLPGPALPARLCPLMWGSG